MDAQRNLLDFYECITNTEYDLGLSERLKNAINDFCTENKKENGFRWIDVKTEAMKTENPDEYMKPYLILRELLNIYALLIAQKLQ